MKFIKKSLNNWYRGFYLWDLLLDGRKKIKNQTFSTWRLVWLIKIIKSRQKNGGVWNYIKLSIIKDQPKNDSSIHLGLAREWRFVMQTSLSQFFAITDFTTCKGCNTAAKVLVSPEQSLYVKKSAQKLFRTVFRIDPSFSTALRYIDKDNFECPKLGVLQKCPMILGEYQSPGGKFFWKKNLEKNLFLGKKRVFSKFFQH